MTLLSLSVFDVFSAASVPPHDCSYTNIRENDDDDYYSNTYDKVYGAVNMAQVLQQSTWFI